VRDVFFLSAGAFKVPAAMLEPLALKGLAGLRRSVLMSNTVAVIVRDSGDVTLIDCGWSREVCAAPARVLGRVQASFLGLKLKSGDAIVDQLRPHGIDAARVKTIVTTHLHFDHVGGACDFPNAEVVCSDVELSAFRVRPPAVGYRVADLETARLRPVYLGSGPSYGFPASHDLFGDGEVVLLDAHGHTPGLVAVAIRSRERSSGGGRCYVHIGDAAYRTWEWALSPAGPSALSRLQAWRPDLLRLRYAALRDCEADPRKPVIVPSHDQAVFEGLPHAPTREAAA
jgi:glyoxylase-like metal-dependent hydrolase (beta-lactamase superfamily II)